MTSTTRISNLPAGNADAPSTAPVVQDGATKKIALGSAAGKTAGGAAGNVPVLAAGGVLAPGVGGTGLELLATSLDDATKYVGYDAQGIFGLHALPSGGGGGGGGTLGPGSINSISLFSGPMLADEEAVLDAGASNTSLVGNATLKGIVEDISSDHLYGDWSAATVTVQATLPASGALWPIPNLGGDGNMAAVNASNFNAITANIGSGRPNFFGPACSGLPSLSSGTLRGAIVILDDSGTRWAIPVSNPEGPDSEAAFKLAGDAWAAVDWRASDLRLDFARIKSNDARYEVFGSLALHGPTANELRDEVVLARADGRHQYALRVGYSTAQSQYEIVTAKRDAVFNLQDGEVTPANLASSNAAAVSKVLAVDGTDLSKFKYIDQATPEGNYEATALYSASGPATGVSPSDTATRSIAGRQWSSFDAFYAVIADGSDNSASQCASGFRAIDVAQSCEMPYGTTMRVYDSGGVARYIFQSSNDARRLVKIYGINFAGAQAALAANSVGYSQINATGKAANKYLSINASNNGLAAVDAPSASTSITDEVIYNTNTQTINADILLLTGKSFADYDFIYIRTLDTGPNPDKYYTSTLMAHKHTIGLNNGITFFFGAGNPAGSIALDIKNNTTFRIVAGGLANHNWLNSIRGIKFS